MPHVEPLFWKCMLYELDLKHSATDATHNICAAYGEDVLILCTCQLWFARFRFGQRSPRMNLMQEGRSSSIKKPCKL